MHLTRTLIIGAALAVAACTPPGASEEPNAEGVTTIDRAANVGGASSASGSQEPNVVQRGPMTGATGVHAGACTLSSIAGVWSLAHLEADEPGVEEMYAQAPYEFTRISPDGSVIYFATNRQFPNVEAVEVNLDLAQRQAGMTFRADIRQGGVYVLMRDGQPFQAFRCTITDQAGRGGAQPGDMIWTNLDNMPALYRVHRRIR